MSESESALTSYAQPSYVDFYYYSRNEGKYSDPLDELQKLRWTFKMNLIREEFEFNTAYYKIFNVILSKLFTIASIFLKNTKFF